MTATLTLADPETERVARLPLSALFSEGGDPSLYIVDDKGEVALKPVAVKSYESNNVVITGGVDEGAKVVVLGVQKLDPAQKVSVVFVVLTETVMRSNLADGRDFTSPMGRGGRTPGEGLQPVEIRRPTHSPHGRGSVQSS